MKTLKKLFIPAVLIICLLFGMTACSTDTAAMENKLAELQAEIAELEETIAAYEKELSDKLDALSPAEPETPAANALAADYGEECYEKLKYIDSVLRDRDCIDGENFQLAQKWIVWNLIQAGYSEETDIEFQPVEFTTYAKKDGLSAVKSYETDGKFYNYIYEEYKFVEAADGAYVKADVISENIVVTKQGKTDQQIIVGAHYDGTGTGDNGSGIALALTTAQKLFAVETEYTVVFVFFTAEEIGLYGSEAYAQNMTQEEIDNTLYMINIDSVVCGDYCYLYGGVQDNENQTVTDTEAFDNAWAVAESLGLSFKKNPWTWGNLSPENYDDVTPDYASPSTGDWSDHVYFKDLGIKYLYMEATNWEIPDYTGYGETYLIGMLMNTENDYLEYIEKYFPGRPLEHLTQFSALLNALLTQTDLNF